MPILSRIVPRSIPFILTLLLSICALARGEDSTSLAQQGMAALQKGELASAEQLCRKALKLRPESQAAYSCLYNVFNNTNRFEEGLAMATAALERKPKDDFHTRVMARTYSRRADKRFKARDYAGARKDFESALSFVPDEGIALDELGLIHYLSKDYRKAIRYFNRSLKIDLNFAPNYIWRGRCFYAVGKPVMALADYERAKNLKPEVWADIQTDIDDATTASLRKLRTASPAKPTHGIKAIIYDMNKLYAEWKEEISFYTKRLQKLPRDSDAYYFRGSLNFELGANEKAISDFQTAVDIYPEFWGKYLPALIQEAKARQ